MYRAALTLTVYLMDKVMKTQRAMARRMLGVTLKDLLENEDNRQETKLADLREQVATLNWDLAGRMTRQRDGIKNYNNGDLGWVAKVEVDTMERRPEKNSRVNQMREIQDRQL